MSLKYGKTDLDCVTNCLEDSKAKWTEEGWIVEGDLDLSHLDLIELPLIKYIGGDFYCSYNCLEHTSLSHIKVDGDLIFYANGNKFTKGYIKTFFDVGGEIYL